MAETSPQAWERARGLIQTWNEQGVETWAEASWAEDIVWKEPDRFPDAGVHHGRDACVRRMRERFDWLGEVRLELVDVRESGARTMMEVVVHSIGPESGAAASQREFLVYELADERAKLLLEFLDRDEAEAALAAG